jgi:two-component system, OmpR family, sensor histidine kinase MtrB
MPATHGQRLAATFTPLVLAASIAENAVDDPVGGVLVAAAAGLATAMAAAWIGRGVAQVAAEVGRFADRVAAGELSARVECGARGELVQLVASVNAMAARLAREQHARANFIGKVSHELRTPVTVIKGYVYTLRRGEADPARAGRLDVIDGECERLAYLVEDLLELARAQVGELRLSSDTFPLRECVEEVAERLRAVAAQRNVGIEVPLFSGTNFRLE